MNRTKVTTVRADVQVASDEPGIPDESELEGWVEAAVDSSGRVDPGEMEVAIRIVDPDEIRTLNREYRGKDYATNVLSFPAGEIAGLPAGEPRLLGDIVICAAVVAREAREQGKEPADHWAHMIVHGTLHLLGFDHETDAEAAVMEKLETRILAGKSVTDPYAAGL
jgi:probable rRNA maturation factor